jgi:hypothetical protein
VIQPAGHGAWCRGEAGASGDATGAVQIEEDSFTLSVDMRDGLFSGSDSVVRENPDGAFPVVNCRA